MFLRKSALRFFSRLAAAYFLSLFCMAHSHLYAADLTAYAEEWPPYNYLEKGEVKGIASDLLRAACLQAKVDCLFRIVPWARAYRMAQEVPNTLVYSTARTPAREQDFLWVGPILPRTTWVYARTSLNRPVNNVRDLAPYRVGVVRDEAAMNDLLNAGLPDTSLSVQASNRDVIRMLSKANVDAMVDTEVGMAWNLRDAGLDAKAVTRLFKLNDGGAYYFAFNLHSDRELVGRLQSALDRLRRSGKADEILQKYAVKRN